MTAGQKIHAFYSESHTAAKGIYPPHLHPFYELIYVKSGKICVTVNERRVVVPAGGLVLFDRMILHDIYPEELPYGRLCIQIDPEFLHQICFDSRLTSLWYAQNAIETGYLSLSGHPSVVACLERIWTEYQQRDSLKEAAAAYALGLMLVTLRREIPAAFPPVPNGTDAAMLKAKRYIEHHCHEDLAVETMASSFYLSSGYFIQAFRQATGVTPKRYQMLCRLSSARSLLMSTDLAVSEIARQTGFHDTNGFIRYFKKEMRLTPGQYRRKGSSGELEK